MSRPSAIALRRPTCTALTWSAWGRRRVAASPRGARVRQALVERLVRDPSRPVWAQTGGELGPGSAGLWPAPTHAGLPLPVVPAWAAITPKAVPAQQGETGALPRSSRTPVVVGEWPGSAPTFPRRGNPMITARSARCPSGSYRGPSRGRIHRASIRAAACRLLLRFQPQSLGNP